MSEISPASNDILVLGQRAFLFHQLEAAPNGTLTEADLKKAIVKQTDLGLTKESVGEFLGQMVSAGWLREEKVQRVKTYSLTESGKQQLTELVRHIPLLPVKGEAQAPVDEREKTVREAVALHALSSEADKATREEVVAAGKRFGLGLTPATARALLAELVLSGDLHVHRAPNAETFSLTESGRQKLSQLERLLPLLPVKGEAQAPVDEREKTVREAVALHALSSAEADKATREEVVAAGKRFGLALIPATARALLAELVLSGDLHVHRAPNAETFSLTESGKQKLSQLERLLPLLPVKGEPQAPVDEREKFVREAVALHALSSAEADKATREEVVAAGKRFGLALTPATARALLAELVLSGDLHVHRAPNAETFSLTESGKQKLSQLERLLPLLPVKGEPQAPVDEREKSVREAVALHALSSAEADKATREEVVAAGKRFGLGLTPATARALLAELVSSGDLHVHRAPNAETFSLTEPGKQKLRELERYLPLLPAGGKPNLPESEDVREAREVYVLAALDRAPEKRFSWADLEVGFGGKGKPKVAELLASQPYLALFRDQYCLGLNPATTRAVLSDLVHRGDILVQRSNGFESYSLTAAGAATLGRLRVRCPILPPLGKPAAAPSEDVRTGRVAYVLLKLLQSTNYALLESDIAIGSYPPPLKLNHPTAWNVRAELAREGYIALHWDGKEGSYTLTESGKKYLTTLPFEVLGDVTIKGSALTDLLAAARDGGKTAPSGTETEPPKLSGAQLEAAVLDIFQDLLRERFADRDTVPIHEIRHEIARRFGTHAASHALLDEAFLNLRRTDKLRLISISDRSRATAEQLQDSVPGIGETFFYAGKPHAPAQTG